MKKIMQILLILFFAAFLPYGNACALTLGKNITVFDGQTGNSAWYQGQGQGNEDEETEPGTSAENEWDLEGMFLNATNLSLVGEWDFVNGVAMTESWESTYDADGDNYYTSGDIFIDVTGMDHGGTYGYDYVFDVDWSQGNWTLYGLDGSSTYIKSTYRTPYSDPWKVSTPGTTIKSGTFNMARLTPDEITKTGFQGGSTHNMINFDLSPILTDLQLDAIGFNAHFTMECGNDDLKGTAPVPEPATIMLMGFGLFGIAGFTRKKQNMNK